MIRVKIANVSAKTFLCVCGGGVESATPCTFPPPWPSIFSNDSFLVQHPVNGDDRHLHAHAMASDFTVAWQFSQSDQFFIFVLLWIKTPCPGTDVMILPKHLAKNIAVFCPNYCSFLLKF
jgi:hypothetical protein